MVACTFGSTILWRVLLINALEIAQNVHQHRKKAKEKLPDKAKEIWRQLQLKFDKYFPAMEPPVTVTEMLEDGDKTEIWRQLQLKFYKYFPAMEPPVTVTEMLEDGDKTEKTEKNIFGKVDFWSIDKALIFTSTLVLGMSLIVLQCRLDWTAAHEEPRCTFGKLTSIPYGSIAVSIHKYKYCTKSDNPGTSAKLPGLEAAGARQVCLCWHGGLAHGVCGGSPLVPADICHRRNYQKVQAATPTDAAFLLPGHHLGTSGN